MEKEEMSKTNPSYCLNSDRNTESCYSWGGVYSGPAYTRLRRRECATVSSQQGPDMALCIRCSVFTSYASYVSPASDLPIISHPNIITDQFWIMGSWEVSVQSVWKYLHLHSIEFLFRYRLMFLTFLCFLSASFFAAYMKYKTRCLDFQKSFLMYQKMCNQDNFLTLGITGRNWHWDIKVSNLSPLWRHIW